MNININKEEYRLLLDMLSTADWVMHAYAVEEKDYHKGHAALKNKLLSYAKEMGAEDLIEPTEELDGYYETNDYEEYVQDNFIQPFEYKFFWDELMDRLGERDLIKSVGSEQYSQMGFVEKMSKIDDVKEKYANEFENYGLERLEINSNIT